VKRHRNYQRTGCSRVLLQKVILCLGGQINSPPFMEPQVSAPYLQKPATGPYPEPGDTFHTTQPCFPKIQFNIIFSSTTRYSELSLPFRLCNKNFTRISHSCYMPRQLHSHGLISTSYPKFCV
jgi:hypothetical protein